MEGVQIDTKSIPFGTTIRAGTVQQRMRDAGNDGACKCDQRQEVSLLSKADHKADGRQRKRAGYDQKTFA